MAEPSVTHRPRSADLAAELWAGFAAMLVALPSAIGYGVAATAALGRDYLAAGAMAGVVGTIALGLVAPLAGGAPRLISAPCAPAAAVMAALAGQLLAGDASGAGALAPAAVLPLLTVVALLSGSLQLLYGAVGGGRLIKYIPFPVVSGYLSGVAVIIFVGQLPKLLGLHRDVTLWHGLTSPGLWRWQALVVGMATIAGMVVAPRLTRKLPAPVLGVAAGLAAYFALAMADPALLRLEGNPMVVGRIAGGAGGVLAAIPDRLGMLGGLRLSDLQPLLVPALTLSVLLSIDTLKTCVVLDALTRSRHRSNRELLGQGLANLISALFGGMAGSGTMGPTLVNVNSGGRTRLSGFLEGAFALVALLALSPLIGWVPVAALAGILIVVAFRMFDRSSFHLLRQRSTVLDFAVIAAVVVVAVAYSLVAAAGVGLALAIILFIREQMRGSVIRRKVYGHQLSSSRQRLPEEKEILLEAGKLTTVCELQGSLFFGTTDRLFTELEEDLNRCRHLILDMRRVQTVDFTAAHMLEQIEAILAERQGQLVFSHLPAHLPSGKDLAGYFRQLGVVRSTRNVHIFDTLNDALEWAEDRILADARLLHLEGAGPLDLADFDLCREFAADGTLDALRACVVERTFEPGETVFRAGEAGAEMFLVRSGSVRIFLSLEHGRQLGLTTCGRGHLFGDMAFLDRSRRSADAVAITRTEAYVLSRDRFDALARSTPLVGIKVFARLARILAVRLRHTDTELRALQEA
jgi:sulfate permease, SulP family